MTDRTDRVIKTWNIQQATDKLNTINKYCEDLMADIQTVLEYQASLKDGSEYKSGKYPTYEGIYEAKSYFKDMMLWLHSCLDEIEKEEKNAWVAYMTALMGSRGKEGPDVEG